MQMLDHIDGILGSIKAVAALVYAGRMLSDDVTDEHIAGGRCILAIRAFQPARCVNLHLRTILHFHATGSVRFVIFQMQEHRVTAVRAEDAIYAHAFEESIQRDVFQLFLTAFSRLHVGTICPGLQVEIFGGTRFLGGTLNAALGSWAFRWLSN